MHKQESLKALSDQIVHLLEHKCLSSEEAAAGSQPWDLLTFIIEGKKCHLDKWSLTTNTLVTDIPKTNP